jgi:hypothetical protein
MKTVGAKTVRAEALITEAGRTKPARDLETTVAWPKRRENAGERAAASALRSTIADPANERIDLLLRLARITPKKPYLRSEYAPLGEALCREGWSKKLDPAIRDSDVRVWGFGEKKTELRYTGGDTDEERAGEIDFHVRAAVLGVPYEPGVSSDLLRGHWKGQASIDALRRYAIAMGWSEVALEIDEKPLSQHPRVAGSPVPDPPRLAWGKKRMTVEELEARLEKHDLGFFDLDRDSFIAFMKHKREDDADIFVDILRAGCARHSSEHSKEWALHSFALWETALQDHVPGSAKSARTAVERVFTGTLNHEYHEDHDVLRSIARVVRAAALTLSYLETNYFHHSHRNSSTNAAYNREFMKAWDSLDLHPSGSGPVARVRTHPELAADEVLGQESFEKHDLAEPFAEALDANDASVERCEHDGFNVARWLDALQDPRVFAFATRASRQRGRTWSTYRHDSTCRAIREYLTHPIPERWVTAQTVPLILRMANSADFPFEYIRVRRLDRVVGMSQWIADARLIEEPAAVVETRTERLAALIRSFGQEPDKKTCLEAMRAAMSPEQGKEESETDVQARTIEFSEIVSAALEARADGRLRPIKIRAADGDLLLALNRYQHVGAAAMLAALLFDASPERLLASFREITGAATFAQPWVDRTRVLARMDAGALAFACRDVVESGGAMFETLPLRIALASEEMNEEKLESSFLAWAGDRDEYARVVFELATQAPEGSAAREAAMRHLAALLDDGRIDLEAHLLPLVAQHPEAAWLFDKAQRESFVVTTAARTTRPIEAKPERRAIAMLEDFAEARASGAGGPPMAMKPIDLVWLPGAVQQIRAEAWNDRTLLGLTEVFRFGAVPKSTLAFVRDLIDRALIDRVVPLTRSKDARAILSRSEVRQTSVLRRGAAKPTAKQMIESRQSLRIDARARAPSAERMPTESL